MREQKSAELTGSDFYPVGEGRIIGAITGDSQFSPLGANAEEDVYHAERPTTDFGMVGEATTSDRIVLKLWKKCPVACQVAECGLLRLCWLSVSWQESLSKT